MSALKFSILGPSSLILRSASNQSHPSLFCQSVFTINILENILSNFPLEKGVINKILMTCRVFPHKKINRCLTDINQCLTDIFRI